MRSGSVALLLVSSIASAQVARIEAIDIVDYGIYESEVARRIDDSSSASGGRAGVKSIKHKERASTIQARVGLQFGFRFYVEGTPTGAEVRLRSITRFPPQGMHNPNTQKTNHSDVYTIIAKIGSADFRGYAFDEDWEIVPGIWTFEFWEGDRKLVEQRFTVVQP